jgi:hypothetical protein
MISLYGSLAQMILISPHCPSGVFSTDMTQQAFSTQSTKL